MSPPDTAMCSTQNIVGQKSVSQIWHMHIEFCWFACVGNGAGHFQPLQQTSLMAQSGNTLNVMP